MGKNSHILDFSSKSHPKDSQRGSRQLPVLVEQVRSLCIDSLHQHLKHMLAQADDQLFDMSDSGYNNAHFDAMRMLRLKKDGLIRNFHQELVESFDEHLGKSELNGAADTEAMSFENIALVEDSDLEEGIAIDSMVKKAREANSEALEQIRTRLDTLIPTKTISNENNPFEPAFICSAFKKASLTLDIDIESLLVIYKLFERMVTSELDDTYRQVNQFFIDKGVLPELKLSVAHAKSNPARGAHREEVSKRAIEELLDIATAEPSGQSDDGSAVSGGETVVAMLQGLLAHSRGSSAPVYSQSEVIETPKLVSALTQLQTSPALKMSPENAVAADLRGLLGQHVENIPTTAIHNGALGQFNDDMIDIVSMLFDFILDDKNVHVEIKSVIGRLQIPMLKVGLVDRSFFSNKKHPARILLNEIARAGISWEPSDPEANSMLKKIESIVEEITTNFTDDVSIFGFLLDDFEKFRQQVQRRADIFERRTREAEEGKAKAESARGLINKELERICKGKHIPASVKLILKNVWVHVMFLERLKDNEDGWDKVCKIAKLLVWSVQPVEQANHLEKLLGRIPSLVKNLRKGFEIISISPIDATHMLEELEVTHREVISIAKEKIEADQQEDILRLEPAPLIPDAVNLEVQEEEPVKEPEIEEIEIHDIGFSRHETGASDKKSTPKVNLKDSSIQAVERLSAGHWVELEIEQNVTRCKLAAKISSTGKYIFVNRSGVKVAEFLTNELATEYQLGRIKILDDEALFDRALESVIANLRAMKD